MKKPIIEIKNLKNRLGDEWIHDGLNLAVHEGEILAIIGGSGAGKTTLLRCILMLQKPEAGSIEIAGTDIVTASDEEIAAIRHRCGVVFQQGALFSSLTVLDNVIFPLRIFTKLPARLQEQIGALKIALVGLPMDAATKYPAELSGGMVKRAAVARALALDPKILFLDEPTTGLDPESANALADLILNLRDGMELTVVLITHETELLGRIVDRVAFLHEGKIIAVAPLKELIKNLDPAIQTYFQNVKEKID